MKLFKVAAFHIYFLIHIVEQFTLEYMGSSCKRKLSTFLFLKRYEKASKMKKFSLSASAKIFYRLVNKVSELKDNPEDIRYWKGSVLFQLSQVTEAIDKKSELLKECLDCIPGHLAARDILKKLESKHG